MEMWRARVATRCKVSRRGKEVTASQQDKIARTEAGRAKWEGKDSFEEDRTP